MNANAFATVLLATWYVARSDTQTSADLVRHRLSANIFAPISGKQSPSKPPCILLAPDRPCPSGLRSDYAKVGTKKALTRVRCRARESPLPPRNILSVRHRANIATSARTSRRIGTAYSGDQLLAAKSASIRCNISGASADSSASTACFSSSRFFTPNTTVSTPERLKAY